MDELALQAFKSMFPNRQIPQLFVKFSGRFKEYNANVSIQKLGREIQKLEFSLSKKFLETEEDIRIGAIQYLLNKVYKTKHQTLEIDLYNNFLKHLHNYSKRIKSDPYLEELYHEINEEYFQGLLDKPNLVFKGEDLTVLGHYSFTTDVVSISTALQEDEELLKYVLYHELLHKKHGFTISGNKTMYHTKAFRDDEKKFKVPNIEKKLEQFVRRKKLRMW